MNKCSLCGVKSWSWWTAASCSGTGTQTVWVRGASYHLPSPASESWKPTRPGGMADCDLTSTNHSFGGESEMLPPAIPLAATLKCITISSVFSAQKSGRSPYCPWCLQKKKSPPRTPKYRQFVKPSTRENTLDTINRPVTLFSRAARGHWSCPAYRQKWKLCKPVLGIQEANETRGSSGLFTLYRLGCFLDWHRPPGSAHRGCDIISFTEDGCVHRSKGRQNPGSRLSCGT